MTLLAVGATGVFPPEVAIPGVRLACARPDLRGRHLSPGDGHAWARQRGAEALVEDRSAAPRRRLLAAPPLQPRRPPLGLPPKPPRAALFSATLAELMELSTRPLREAELVRSVDEKPSVPPRPRSSPTPPPHLHHRPNRLAHASKRAGALTLCAAFATRSAPV